MTGTPNTWQACGFPALAYFTGLLMNNDLCKNTMTFAEMAKPGNPSASSDPKELLLLSPTELNDQEERLLKTVTKDFG